MRQFSRLFPLLAFLLGLLGVVVCAVAVVAIWAMGSRLSQANESVFDAIDKSMVAVRERVLRAQQRVQESKLTTDDIAQSVTNWTREETGERFASRLKVEEKTERLALGLRQADVWLETSEASIQGVQQAFEIAGSLGAPVDAALINTLLDRLGSLRRQLKQSTETVDAIREHVAATAEGKTSEERISQLAQLSLRMVATLGEVDSRLGEFADRLSAAQTEGQRLESKTHFYIVTAHVCVVILIAWMAAGQVSLCRQGWKNLAQSRATP